MTSFGRLSRWVQGEKVPPPPTMREMLRAVELGLKFEAITQPEARKVLRAMLRPYFQPGQPKVTVAPGTLAGLSKGRATLAGKRKVESGLRQRGAQPINKDLWRLPDGNMLRVGSDGDDGPSFDHALREA